MKCDFAEVKRKRKQNCKIKPSVLLVISNGSFRKTGKLRRSVTVGSDLLVVAFSSHARILGRMFDNSFPACAFCFLFLSFFLFLLFFLKDISSRTLIPLFRPGSVHSGSES